MLCSAVHCGILGRDPASWFLQQSVFCSRFQDLQSSVAPNPARIIRPGQCRDGLSTLFQNKTHLAKHSLWIKNGHTDLKLGMAFCMNVVRVGIIHKETVKYTLGYCVRPMFLDKNRF